MCNEKPYVFEQATFKEAIASGLLKELMNALDGKATIIDKKGTQVQNVEDLLKLIHQQ